MEIKEITEFYIQNTIEEPDETPKIIIENKTTKKQLEILGKVLEAQYCIENNFLLLVTEGNPFEEALYVYYLGNDLQVKDSLELSVMYAEGMLRNLSIVEQNKICFSFFDKDEHWVLEIFSNSKLSFFKNKHPVKRRFPAFNKSWLSLTRK